MLSNDRGNTWRIGSNPLSDPNQGPGADPAIAYGPDGTLYVVAAPTLTAYKDDGSGKAASEDVLINGYGFEPEKLAPGT